MAELPHGPGSNQFIDPAKMPPEPSGFPLGSPDAGRPAWAMRLDRAPAASA